MLFAGVAISFLMLLVVVVCILRRSRPAKPDATSYDFAIEELLRLLRSGRISQEEFERAKASVLSRRANDAEGSPTQGFEVLPPRKPMIQSLEERIAP